MSRIGEVFDTLIKQNGLKNDFALAMELDMEPSNVSRLRHHRSASADLILRIHDCFGMPVSEIKKRLDVPALPTCEACRVPSKVQALVQHVVKQFVVGARSQGVKTSG